MSRIFIWLICFILVGTGLAENGDGGYAGAFLRMGMGARAKALGDAYTAVPEGAVSGFYNPALLPHLERRYLDISFAFLPLDRHLDYIAYAQSLVPPAEDGDNPLKAGFSLAYIRAGVDHIDGRDFSGNSIGDFSHSEHAFYLSFGLCPLPFLSVGVSGKVLYSRFPSLGQDDSAISSTGFGLDVGAFAVPLPNLTIAAVLHDNLSKYTWNTDKVWERGTSTTYAFPQILRAGISYRLPKDWLLITAEMENSAEQNPRYHVGAELYAQDVGALRIGWDHDLPTFGIGFKMSLFGHQTGLDYAYVAAGDSPRADHIFNWSFIF